MDPNKYDSGEGTTTSMSRMVPKYFRLRNFSDWAQTAIARQDKSKRVLYSLISYYISPAE